MAGLVRKLLISWYAHFFSELRAIDRNVKIAFHCDGKVEWALEDLMEARRGHHQSPAA